MKSDLSKICSDSLRNFAKEHSGIKLKAAHAHELVAAYFGHQSRNAMLADTRFPVDDLSRAEVVVMMPDAFIDERRNCLEGLPKSLPDSYALGEAFYKPLFASGEFATGTPPFRSFRALAAFLFDRSEARQSLFRLSSKKTLHHVVVVQDFDSEVLLTVLHMYGLPAYASMVDGRTIMKLRRVAGRIGFSDVKVLPSERWSAEARRSLKSLGVTL